MRIQIATDKKRWDEFVFSQEYAEFLQSWEWGEFQKAAHLEPLRLEGVEEGRVVFQAQGFIHPLPLGLRYWYAPRIPGCGDKELLAIGSFLKERGVCFARIEPTTSVSSASAVSVRSRQPQETLMLDLSLPEETLLSQMHSKTRYNIGLAEKKGVEIREGKNIDWFWQLNQETTARDTFKSHDKEYYAEMLEMPIAHQLTAFFENTPVASQIYIAFGGTCTYLHGASSNEHRNTMAPYLLQWRSVQFAKKFGNSRYDFWGISPEPRSGEPATSFHNLSWKADHSWTGVTRYKAGFGGQRKSYPSAFELPVRLAFYRLFQLGKRFF